MYKNVGNEGNCQCVTVVCRIYYDNFIFCIKTAAIWHYTAQASAGKLQNWAEYIWITSSKENTQSQRLVEALG